MHFRENGFMISQYQNGIFQILPDYFYDMKYEKYTINFENLVINKILISYSVIEQENINKGFLMYFKLKNCILNDNSMRPRVIQ